MGDPDLRDERHEPCRCSPQAELGCRRKKQAWVKRREARRGTGRAPGGKLLTQHHGVAAT